LNFDNPYFRFRISNYFKCCSFKTRKKDLWKYYCTSIHRCIRIIIAINFFFKFLSFFKKLNSHQNILWVYFLEFTANIIFTKKKIGFQVHLAILITNMSFLLFRKYMCICWCFLSATKLIFWRQYNELHIEIRTPFSYLIIKFNQFVHIMFNKIKTYVIYLYNVWR